MALSIVEHDPRHAVREQVKSDSESWFRRRRARTRRAEVAQAQPSPVSQSEAPTRLLPPVEHAAQRAVKAAGQPPLHRDEHTVPDKVAINMIRVCSQALAEGWSSTRLHRELGMHNEELEKRWHRERDGGRKIEARRAAVEAQAAQVAEAIEAAVFVEDVTGRPVDLDPDAMGSRLAAMTANAHEPEQPTMQFPAITEDMPDPRVTVTVVPAVANGSPVHVPGDGTHPPIPELDDEDEFEEADPGDRSLAERVAPPKRTPHATVIAAPVGPDGGPLHGKRLNPRDVQLGGAWVFYGGAGGSGPVYRLVASVLVREDDTLIAYVCGDTQTVKRDAKNATVRVLTSSEAADLLAQYKDEGASL